jgi:hypothetical protein
MHDDPHVYPERNIRSHAVARLRADQPLPAYRVSDGDFDDLHFRLGDARRTFALGRDDQGPFIAYTFGTTTVRVYAGGPKQEPNTVEVIEL